MGLFDRFSKGEPVRSIEFQDIYEELIRLHKQLQVWEGQLNKLRKVDHQLQEVASIRQSAMMVMEKLSELYRDVQLISEAIRKDDRETRQIVADNLDKMEVNARNAVASEVASFKEDLSKLVEQTKQEMSEQMQEKWQEWMKSFEEKQSQQDSTIESLQEQLREWQQKNKQLVTGLNAEFRQKEERWESQLKQRDRLVIIAMLVCVVMSLCALFN